MFRYFLNVYSDVFIFAQFVNFISYSFNFSDFTVEVAMLLDLFDFLSFAKLGFKLLLELLSHVCSSPAMSI